MGAADTKNLIRRLDRLEQLADAYAHVLLASELERALPGLISVLTRDGRSQADVAGLLKEILQRGGPQLLVDLDDVERTARQVKDLEVFAVLNRVRQTFHYVARYNAAAVLRRLEQSARPGPEAGSLQKEIQAFQRAVARLEPGTHDVEDVFGDEDPVPGTTAPPPVAEPSSSGPTRDGPADDPGIFDSPAFPPAHRGQANHSGMPWSPTEESPPWAASGDAVPRAVASEADWLQDRVEIFNAMLLAWAYNEPLNPDASPLVRRERFTAAQFRALHRELLEQGAARLIGVLAGVEEDGEEGERVRALRGRIFDGAVAAVPRLLGLISGGGHLHPDADGTPADERQIRADLIDYLSQAADLYPAGTALRDRLLYLAEELRAATSL